MDGVRVDDSTYVIKKSREKIKETIETGRVVDLVAKDIKVFESISLIKSSGLQNALVVSRFVFIYFPNRLFSEISQRIRTKATLNVFEPYVLFISPVSCRWFDLH